MSDENFLPERVIPSTDSAESAVKQVLVHPMRRISVEKVTLNIGAGKNEELLKKGLKLLEKIAGQKPVKTTTKKRIPGWGLRPGLAIGCKLTVRKNAPVLLKKLLAAKRYLLSESCFDQQGNLSFGIPEYIDIAGMEYDPELKIMGLEVAVTLHRSGYALRNRKIRPGKIGKNHRLTREEAIAFIRSLGVEVTP